MQKSDARILTTHVGSLPRSPALLAMLVDQEQGKPVDAAQLKQQIGEDLQRIVALQKDAGVDVASDGEIPRLGFSFYVKDRMSGFGGESNRGIPTDIKQFPGYAVLKMGRGYEAIIKSVTMYSAPQCQCRVHYDPSLTAVKQELSAFGAALDANGGKQTFADTFVTAATPGIVSTTLLRAAGNSDYRTDRDYVFGLAAELKKEYELIVAEGHILQLDAPDLAGERQLMFDGKPLRDFLDRVEMHIEALNLAVADIPRERIRMHICWGNSDSPHLNDVELKEILPLLYRAKVGALSMAAASPRHQHEFKLFKQHPLPDGMILIPGVIDVTTNTIEHPEVVADRIEAFARVVGDPSRIIAGTDCGFSTFAGYVLVAEDVAWMKMKVLAQGAALATKRLW